MARCAVLILAGGSGSRLGSEIPKQYLNLNGLSVLRRTIDAFLAHPGIEAVQVVIGAQDRERYDNAIGDADIRPPVSGGASRQESGRNGLEALADDAPDYVLIHDAARPFADSATIDRVLHALET
ncbi:MAG: bifunctional 2-C-methyl-D-erythritol 4-phosphate cytidylyltransferase/2-C-methyl-D-erythritol 2,4-cyclodiphosphate synthase, partial [Alphaproteobacteria bacterium]|nr:bifunctional 2-C-methyl-D-erythritol 4-phosphate cytidylyltransferase/2-C-methyl-D-erythritol 2,4-cyclodiphosphate synthase [Alphaproteobacteria bacterium]